MKNEKSYTEQMKRDSEKNVQSESSFVMDVYIQMVLDEALLNHKKSLLQKEIDHALDAKDRQSFLLLSEQYNKLITNSNT